MSETNRSPSAGLFLAFLAGAVTGAAVALLTAPQSGGETRRRLKGLARDAADRAGHVPPALNEAYARAARAARRAFIESLDDKAPSSEPPSGRTGH
jgi:gas vesicle protein